MFKKYQKTYRIKVPQFDVKGKLFLSRKEVSDLLGSMVWIEEKMDGANTGIIRHKKGFSLQKRGSLVGQSEHEQFGRFHNWAWHQNYNKLMALPKNHIVYGEWMYAQHHIYYDKLPDYFLVFDVWNGQKFLNVKKRNEFCIKYGFAEVPYITKGIFNVDDLAQFIFGKDYILRRATLPIKSAYGNRAEGIVIKRYTKKRYLRAKLVHPKFVKEIDESEHWTRKKLRINKLHDKISLHKSIYEI